jgi:predicted DNA-binding protein
MALNEAIPVRFSSDLTVRLKAVSDRSGVAVAHLIRMATEDFLNRVEQSGRITIDVSARRRRYPKPVPAHVMLNEASSPPTSAPAPGRSASPSSKR